jgi:hypothetical protein
MRTREEHLEWCKERARVYLDKGRVADAIASMMCDLRGHPDFNGIEAKMGLLGIFYAANNDLEGAKRFVEGFR